MHKDPKYDLKFQYRRVVEASTAAALLLVILLLMTFKKFDVDVKVRDVDAPAIQVEEIPITRTVKKFEVPRKPTVPIEDPTVDPAQEVDLPDLEDFPDINEPPPPPPPAEDHVPFWKVEIKPTLVGGQQAIADYIYKNNLFPKVAAELGISGDVIIEFVVDTLGVPRNVQVKEERPKELGFGEAGVKVMQAMRFTPGRQRDRAVQVIMQQPISFKID